VFTQRVGLLGKAYVRVEGTVQVRRRGACRGERTKRRGLGVCVRGSFRLPLFPVWARCLQQHTCSDVLRQRAGETTTDSPSSILNRGSVWELCCGVNPRVCFFLQTAGQQGEPSAFDDGMLVSCPTHKPLGSVCVLASELSSPRNPAYAPQIHPAAAKIHPVGTNAPRLLSPANTPRL
jgi:hypothetical protein